MTTMNDNKISLIIQCIGYAFFWAFFIAMIAAATTHKHGQHQGERLKDGSFPSHDSNHYGIDKEHDTEFDHEAMLGSTRKAEEFHQLPAEESKRRLKLLVSTQIDTNNDQFVDKHELKAHILRSFKALSEEESNDRFDEINKNNDEFITWIEYLWETYEVNVDNEPEVPVIPTELNSESNELIEDDKLLFLASDSDKDGKLNRDEFVHFISPEEHPDMLPIILNQTLRDKDTDKDGFISFQEFVGDKALDHDKEWLLVEKERFDSEYDKDGDGILNGNEILSWMVPSNDDVATDEVNHLFAASDADQDGRLSYDEILDNHDLFVGSEATDYGDHLHEFKDEL